MKLKDAMFDVLKDAIAMRSFRRWTIVDEAQHDSDSPIAVPDDYILVKNEVTGEEVYVVFMDENSPNLP